MNESVFKQIVARNLAYYRKLNSFTQAELAEKINYSDKSVSKWERGDGIPDVYVLTMIASLYNITVDNLLQENLSEAQPLPPQKQKVIIPTMAVGLIWLVASIVFLALRVFFPDLEKAWLVFILAVPASCIVSIVFMKIWWSLFLLCVFVSALIWSSAVNLYLFITIENMQLIFMIAGILQILTILWYILKHNPQKKR